MKSLSGLDGAFLSLETPATPMHVGSLHLFELPPGYRRNFYQSVKRMMATRLHLAPVFRRRLARMPLQFANPVWIDGDIDLDYHIRRIALPAPGSWQQLQDCVARLHADLLDRSRPLWMLYVIDGLASGDQGYYIKVHHALIDGKSGVQLAAALFDLTPVPGRVKRVKSPQSEEEAPGMLALAAAALRHDGAQYRKLLDYLPDLARTVAAMLAAGDKTNAPAAAPGKRIAGSLWRNVSFGPRTPLNGTISGKRAFAALSLPLDEVKAIATAEATTLNDVVLALCGGALRRYLERHGGIPSKSLIATMPISLRAAGNREFNTQATLSLVSLATDIADPVKRLHAVQAAAAATKSVAKRAKSVIPVNFPTIGVPWIVGGLASLYARTGLADAIPPIANVVISNVPGPEMPLYVAGARMSAYWPLSIVEHGIGLNITLMSYAGTLGIGFTAASCAVPHPQELVADLLAAHEELKHQSLRKSRQPAKRRPQAARPAAAKAAKPGKAKASRTHV